MSSFLWDLGFVVADHGVEGDEQFAGDGDDGDLQSGGFERLSDSEFQSAGRFHDHPFGLV